MTKLFNSFGFTPAAPFSPLDISGLKGWWRGDGDLWSDTSRTTPATVDSTLVAVCDDMSGSGNHISQVTSSKRPTLKTGILNSKPVLRFDGGDTLSSSAASGLDSMNFTWVLVLKKAASAAHGFINIGSTAGSGNRYWTSNSTVSFINKENVVTVVAGTTSIGSSTWRTLFAEYDDTLPVNATNIADTSTYDAFGVLVKFSNGTLMEVYREGNDHFGTVGSIVRRLSTDNGITWSSGTYIHQESGVDLRNVSGGLTSTGRFVIFYARYTPATTSFTSIVTRYSDDNGVTWSSPVTISTTGMTIFSPHGSLVQTDDGQLLSSWYGDDGTTYKVFVVKSSDNGVTWGSSIEVISGLAATSSNSKFTESCFAAVGDNTVIGLIRADNGTAFTQVKSTDNGATWAIIGQVTFDTWTNSSPNTPPWLLVLGSRVFCFYYQRVANTMRVVWADKTALISGVSAWGHRADLFTCPTADSGYSSVVALSSGRLLGVAYRGATSSDADLQVFTYPRTSTLLIDGSHDAAASTRQTFNSGSNIWIGSERDLAEWFNGDFAEILVYNRPLTIDEIQQLAAYLKTKYGITWADI